MLTRRSFACPADESAAHLCGRPCHGSCGFRNGTGESRCLCSAWSFDRIGRCVDVVRLGAHIELEHAGDHDDRLELMAVFEQGKLQCLGAVDKQSAAKMLLVLDDPMTATVSANIEKRRARRGRFSLI